MLGYEAFYLKGEKSMSNENNFDYVLTEPEIAYLIEMVEKLRKKLEIEQDILEKYRQTHKVQVGAENMSPDLGYVTDVFRTKSKLDYYEDLLQRYILANPQSDAVEIGSFVELQIGEFEQPLQIFVTSENLFNIYDIDGYRVISIKSPIGQDILGKKEGDLHSYNTPSAKVTCEVKKVENVKTNTNEKQKHL